MSMGSEVIRSWAIALVNVAVVFFLKRLKPPKEVFHLLPCKNIGMR